MKDTFGQEFTVGCKIVPIGGKGQYAGAYVHEVVRITAKRIAYVKNPRWPDDLSYIAPGDAIVVDKLITE
jgi:hypothetical protein